MVSPIGAGLAPRALMDPDYALFVALSLFTFVIWATGGRERHFAWFIAALAWAMLDLLFPLYCGWYAGSAQKSLTTTLVVLFFWVTSCSFRCCRRIPAVCLLVLAATDLASFHRLFIEDRIYDPVAYNVIASAPRLSERPEAECAAGVHA